MRDQCLHRIWQSIAVLVIAVAYFAWDKVSTPDLPRPAEAPEAEQASAEALDPATEHPARNDHSIVVLPLVNMTTLKQAKIQLKAFFLRIAVKHE